MNLVYIFGSVIGPALLYLCILSSFALTFNLFLLCDISRILENLSTGVQSLAWGLAFSRHAVNLC